jgi:hypothetical protein
MTNNTVDDEAIVQRYLDAIQPSDPSYRSRLRASLAARPEPRRFSWRWPALGTALAVALTTASVFIFFWPRAATPVSARVLIQRAVQAARIPIPLSGTSETTFVAPPPYAPPGTGRDVGSYRLISSWAFRDGTHFRLDTLTEQPALDSGRSVVIANGSNTLWYSSQRRLAYRIRGFESAYALATDNYLTEMPIGQMGPDLRDYNNPNTGNHAQVIGQTRLLGRKTYILKLWPLQRSLRPKYRSCSGARQCHERSRGYGYALYWVDKTTSIILRIEEHGVPSWLGRQDFLYRVTSIRFGSDASPAQLSYSPPAPVRSVPRWTWGGPGETTEWTFPAGFVAAGPPDLYFSVRGSNSEADTAGTSSFSVSYVRGSRYAYVQEVVRPGGLPARLKIGKRVQARTCTAWTGRYADGPRWVSLARGRVSLLLVTTGFSQPQLMMYASRVCTAPIFHPPR